MHGQGQHDPCGTARPTVRARPGSPRWALSLAPGSWHSGCSSPVIMAKAPYAIAWLLGIPIPILILVYLFSRAC